MLCEKFAKKRPFGLSYSRKLCTGSLSGALTCNLFFLWNEENEENKIMLINNITYPDAHVR
ncbi:MAG: hypothetical protein JWP69_1564 [Flaviaesturariibacter sp.]|nr:hypothetical protein [Flaviaesturariibacter sp.]